MISLEMQCENEIRLYQSIFKLFKENGNTLIDEVDTILNVLKSAHYTVGKEAPLDNVYIETGVDLYNFLSTDHEINQRIRFSFSQTPGPVPFTKDLYDKEVKPLLCRAVLEGKLGKEDKELQKFLSSLNEEERVHIGNYLSGEMEEGEKLLIKKASEHVQDAIAIYKEQITELIPLTAQKNLNEHYGRSSKGDIDKSSHVAIPYTSSKPSVNSQFGTELEQQDYTIAMVLEEGIPQAIVEKEILRIRLLFEEESKRSNQIIEKLPSYQLWLRLTGGHYPILNTSPQEMLEIGKRVNEDRTIQFDLIRRYILPEIKTYETQLNADGQLYGVLYNQLQGFSGTLWNAKTFTKKLEKIIPSKTTIETLDLLLKNSSPTVRTIATLQKNREERGNVKKLVQEIYSTQGSHGSIIDAAGLFRDVTDREMVAEEMYKESFRRYKEKCEATGEKEDQIGVAYYDSHDLLVVLTEENGKFINTPLSKSSLTKNQLIPFWDQQHTFGSDIKVSMNMTAEVSVGRHTLLRDLEQAVWRLRGLAKGQTANLIVSSEDEQIIKATLKKVLQIEFKKGESLTSQQLIFYVIYNQSQRQGVDQHRSLKQKMQAILLEKVFSVILDPKLELNEIATLYDACRELFETNQRVRPFELFGRTQNIGKKEEVVRLDVEKMLNSKAMEAFHTNPILKSKFDVKKIEESIIELAQQELQFLPDWLVESGKYGKQRTVQVEVSKETQKESQKETRQEKQIPPPPSPNPLPILTWNKEQLFNRTTYSPTEISQIMNRAPKKEQNPLIGVSDLLKAYPSFSQLSNYFDPKLSASLNLCPIFGGKHLKHYVYTPFDAYQKEITYVLAVEDKQSGEMQLVLLDQNDAEQFKVGLNKDKTEQRVFPREVTLALYHLDGETVDFGKESFDPKRFKEDPKLLPLVVQAKFFRGDSQYNEAELKVLENWMKQTDPKALCQLFKDSILVWKEESRKLYENSPLHQMFIKFGADEMNNIK